MVKFSRYSVFKICIIVIAGMLTVLTAFADKAPSLSFVENKGQWADSFLFTAELPGGNMLITTSGFVYCYTSDSDMHRISEMREAGLNADSEKVDGHWYKVSFVGSNPDFKYHGEGKRARYINYFHGNDSSKWKGNIGMYQGVKEEGVYDGVDLHMYSKGTSLKYDFIVAPGSNPGQIALRYEGIEPAIDVSGNLHIITAVNEIIEEKPFAYQVINGDTIAVACSFKLEDNVLSFDLPEGYDTAVTLIIDPQMVFATYSGAGLFIAGYFSFCTTYDNTGNLYAGGAPLRGFWLPDPLWPTTPGAFQESWTSIYEPMACINKYDATGNNLIFSTYYGGAGPNDIPHAMICNEQNELILAGSTGSFNLPVTPGCFDDTKSGGTDMFVAHFSEDGSSLMGATYIGGSLGNSINAIDWNSTSGFFGQNKTSPVQITLDSLGNIWGVTNTSTIDFPVTNNAFQPSFGGGNCDGIIIGLNPDCSQLLYGTYLGGSNTDVAYDILVNNQGNLVVCGGTMSNDLPATAGSYMPASPGNGEWDAYVTIINPVSGNLLQATYVGTNGKELATRLQIDGNDNIYITGPTFGNYPVSQDVYAMPGTDLFVDKLAPDLSTSILSTRLGRPQGQDTTVFPTVFLLDNCDHIYVGGMSFTWSFDGFDSVWRGGLPLTNMPLTPDAFQTAPAPFWFCVLDPDFSGLLYATYLGVPSDYPGYGDHTHVGINRLDPNGILYHSICVGSLYYPGTTPSSWSPYNKNGGITVEGDTFVGGQDIVSFKFRFDLSGTDAGTIVTDQNDSGCAPYTLQFSSLTYAAQTYYWDFGDGTTATDASPVHTFTEAGTYQVMLAIHNDTVICKNDDTAYKTVTIFNPQVPDIITGDTLVCDSVAQVLLQVQVTNPGIFGNDYEWVSVSGGGIISYLNNVAVVNPNIDTAYVVTVWDTMAGYCGFSNSDTVFIDYKPRRLWVSPGDTLICRGSSVHPQVVYTPGYSFSWSPVSGVSDVSVAEPVLLPEAMTTYIVTASYPGCMDTSVSMSIRLDDRVVTTFVADRDSLCTGESVWFAAGSEDSTVTGYVWDFGDDSYLELGSGGPEGSGGVAHGYDASGVMIVSLTTRTRSCPDTTLVDTVHVFGLPVVNLGADTGLCLQGSPVYLQNLSGDTMGVGEMLWSTGDTTATLKVVHPGLYRLTVKASPIGCSNSDEVEVKKDCYIDIPNVFSPNGDGVNDYFFPRQLLSKSVTGFRMEVFNRWGQVVFETESIEGRGWDGRLNGREQPGGVYVYIIDVELDGMRNEHYEGNVTLLR